MTALENLDANPIILLKGPGDGVFVWTEDDWDGVSDELLELTVEAVVYSKVISIISWKTQSAMIIFAPF